MRKVIIVIVSLVACAAFWALPAVGRAAQPEPRAFATPATMNITVPVGLQLGLPYISWQTVDGAANYRLTGAVHMVRVNRDDPFCTPPIEEETRTLQLDSEELIPPEIDHVDLPVPNLPAEDAWFIFDAQAQIEAVDEDGTILAAGAAGGIAETQTQCPTPTPAITLPPTGSGGGGGGSFALPAAIAAFALAAGVAFALALRVRRRPQ